MPDKDKFKVTLAREPAKYWERLDQTTQKRIKAKLAELEKDPFDPQHSKDLTGRDERSCRVGDYRILFFVDLKTKTASVTKIAARGGVYR